MAGVGILVVDDESAIRDLLQDALEQGGFTVCLAESGEAAIAALEQPDADCRALVTDIKIGRDQPTGWDVARRARELNAALPVVYVTGDAGGDWAANGVPNSVLIAKPFAAAQILTAVAQLMNVSDASGQTPPPES